MTTIAIKDGIMAVDSAVTRNDTHIGAVEKWVDLGERGVLCGDGALAKVINFMIAVERDEQPPEIDQCCVYWLKPLGAVLIWEGHGPWVEMDAPFFAGGTGADIALGAMAAGASAKQAVEIACQFDTYTAGPVHTLRPEQ